MLWKPRKTRGPDVEMIIYIPIAIALESKPTADAALKEIGQVIKYLKKGIYDAVLLRLESPPRDNSELRTLIEVAKKYGIGIILGGKTYAPLMGFEDVLVEAQLRLRGNPALLYQRRGRMEVLNKHANTVKDQLEDLSCFRKYFFKNLHGG